MLVVDDLSAGRAGRLDQEVVPHKVSITDPAALAAVVEGSGAELVCHLAAQIDVRASVAFPAEDAQANVVGTVNVLEAARRVGARVLFASSGGALYGRDAPIPSREDVLALPESPYGIAKYCAECYIGLYNRLHGTSHSVLRLANVYGPRQDPAGEAGVITIFCASALGSARPTIYGDGTQTRDYVYVGDVVAAFLAAADRGRPGTWNIGTGLEVSVLDLVEIIAGIAGRELTPVFAPARRGSWPAACWRWTGPPASLAGGRGPRWPRGSAGSTSGSRPGRPTGPAISVPRAGSLASRVAAWNHRARHSH